MSTTEIARTTPPAEHVKASPKLGTIVDPADHFLCPRCLKQIEIECVWRGNDERDPDTHRPFCMIRILCDHCNKGFEAPCGYASGMLRPLKPPTEIGDARVMQQLRKRVDHNRSVIQNSKR